MLRIPENHRLIFSEYICPMCDLEFYVPLEHTTFKCPRLHCDFAGIQINGDFHFYSKTHDQA